MIYEIIIKCEMAILNDFCECQLMLTFHDIGNKCLITKDLGDLKILNAAEYRINKLKLKRQTTDNLF